MGVLGGDLGHNKIDDLMCSHQVQERLDRDLRNWLLPFCLLSFRKAFMEQGPSQGRSPEISYPVSVGS